MHNVYKSPENFIHFHRKMSKICSRKNDCEKCILCVRGFDIKYSVFSPNSGYSIE